MIKQQEKGTAFSDQEIVNAFTHSDFCATCFSIQTKTFSISKDSFG